MEDKIPKKVKLAKARYKKAVKKGEKPNISEISRELGLSPSTLSRWKSKYKWDDDPEIKELYEKVPKKKILTGFIPDPDKIDFETASEELANKILEKLLKWMIKSQKNINPKRYLVRKGYQLNYGRLAERFPESSRIQRKLESILFLADDNEYLTVLLGDGKTSAWKLKMLNQCKTFITARAENTNVDKDLNRLLELNDSDVDTELKNLLENISESR